jgi:hypothetical protein
MLLLLNRNIYKWRTTSRVWCPEFHLQGGGVFIGVQGLVTDLIKSVTRQVLAGWPSHVAGQPPSPASTDFQLWISYYRLLESVPMKPTRERLQSGAGRPPPGPLVNCLCTVPPHVRCIPGVTLILVEFQFPL